MLVSLSLARSTVGAALQQAGVPEEHAVLQLELLFEAELAGRPSHGLLRVPHIIRRIHNGVANPLATGTHHWRGALLEVDGDAGLGPVIADRALRELLERAPNSGVALAAIRNSGHIGMLGWYADRIARQGFVLIALTTSEALVHPWGGRSALLGTNPIAIGVPTADGPFVMDMATSLVSMGQIHDYARHGRSLPEGWALDAEGEPTTDAHAAKLGSIAPFGGPKGYALGLAFEVLVTALTASAIGRDVRGTLDIDQLCNKGDVFIVIDPGANNFVARRISDYLDLVRSSGGEGYKVTVPGDRAATVRAANIASGITVADGLWEELTKFAEGVIL